MYHVVGCNSCSAVWVIKAHKHDSATCPRCGKQHQTRKLKALAEGDTAAIAREKRGLLLAEREGYGEEFKTVLESG